MFWELCSFQKDFFMPSHLLFEIHQPQYLLHPLFSLSPLHTPPLSLFSSNIQVGHIREMEIKLP